MSAMLFTAFTDEYFGIVNYFYTAECREIKLVDAPVSGGVKRAADGTLTV
jgi:hypothetical protein